MKIDLNVYTREKTKIPRRLNYKEWSIKITELSINRYDFVAYGTIFGYRLTVGMVICDELRVALKKFKIFLDSEKYTASRKS